MIYDLLRVIAALVGVILVLGGGICTAVGVPMGLMALVQDVFRGLTILFTTACGFGVLLIGVFLLKVARGEKKAEPAPQRSNSGHDEPPGG